MEHPENSGEYKGLAVNKGIEQPSSVNPYLKRKPKKRQLSVAEFVEGIVKGDITILSQAVTLVESVKPEHQAVAQEVIEKCLPHSGNSVRIGISGVPGAGKSTSIDVFGLHVLEKGGKLAVLAIDPSSERSKGSILGDKTRMEQLSVHPKSFYPKELPTKATRIRKRILSALAPRQVRWEEWHAKRVRRLYSARLPDSIRFLWKPSGWDRVKRLFILW